jgi:hypothetical protein
MLLFLLTVSPAIYAMSEIESRKTNRDAVKVQMVTIRSRRRALDRRMNPYMLIGSYDPISLRYTHYGNWNDHVLA